MRMLRVMVLALMMWPARGVSAAPVAELPAGIARIHYHRPRADYAGWGLHAWEDAAVAVAWGSPLAPAGTDAYGAYWDVALKPDAKKLGFIVHKGEQKDPGVDQFLDLTKQREAWLVSGRPDVAASPPDVAGLAFGDLSRSRAHWIDRTTLVWPGAPADAEFQLLASPDAKLRLTREGVSGGETIALRVAPEGLSAAQRAEFPYLATGTVVRLDGADAAKLRALLRGQTAIALRAAGGSRDATALQLAGVLDDVCAYDGSLAATWGPRGPLLRLWAPTARKVRLMLYAGPRSPSPESTIDMADSNGVWTATGEPDWQGKYYRYEVTVYTPATQGFETSLVTDPYSRALSRNSERSLLVDLADPSLAPAGWNGVLKPALRAPEDAAIYELHVRDFSAMADDVPDSLRGTFMAFTLESNGTRHLRELAQSGITHIHLLPSFDFATVDEDRSTWLDPGALTGLPRDSEAPQAAVARVRGRDGFNWGYDPAHYGVPEGSYATNPDGTARILEFRRMVQALARDSLRVVMDVVYNHTHAAGLDRFSVLDRIVPGYYQRLNADGAVENSTCCANTASEHRMMEKLMIDDLVHWARDYKVDGFRFDLMGHHMKRNMEHIRDALYALTPARDGVDGSAIVIYGEGWDFGEVSRNQRGVNATQQNLAGTGIGTFNDRLRDAVRGGSPFTDRRTQGFASGLFTTPGEVDHGGEGDRVKLLDAEDRIRVGLAGNLAQYRFTDRKGNTTSGAALGGTGYATDPQECINYVEAHDNETLWDKLLYALPTSTSRADRARLQVLALSVPELAQGIPFFHAGSEILRTKSMDADSYDSGDWFNRLDWTLDSNGSGMGLPSADKNRDRWPTIGDRLRRRELEPSHADLAQSFGAFRDLLEIRRSSPLFRLRTAADIQQRVGFLNTGPAQVPGVIVMTLSDTGEGVADLDPRWSRIVVVFNGTPSEQRISYPAFGQLPFELHPVQRNGRDSVGRLAHVDRPGSALVVPGLTTAVFVAP